MTELRLPRPSNIRTKGPSVKYVYLETITKLMELYFVMLFNGYRKWNRHQHWPLMNEGPEIHKIQCAQMMG
jgi:hypothetical protein